MEEEDALDISQNTNQNKEKKSSWVAMLIVVIMIFMLLIGLLATVFILNFINQGTVNKKNIEKSQNIEKSMSTQKSVAKKMGALFALEPFTLNLNSESGSRVIKINLSLELSNSDLVNELNLKIPLIRDTVIQVITSQTYELLSTTKGKNIFRDSVKNNLNPKLSDGQVNKVYITNMIMQ